MPCGVFKITQIPTEKVNEVKATYALDTPVPTLGQQQDGDGTWTVTATYPACPDGTNPTTTKVYSSS
jgi:hypothetical protein